MSHVTGRAIIRVDGKELRTLDGATLNPGGVSRQAVKGGGKIHGYKEEDMEPTVECKVAHTPDVSLKELGNITDATVIFETDNGKRHVLRNAWTAEPPSLDSSAGAVDLKFAAIECDEA